MSTTTKPVWRTAQGHKEDDFDAIWLYENTWEWTFSEENGIVTLHYLSSKVMPEQKGASPANKEKQFCRNCGKRDEHVLKGFWEPGMCMECHRLPVIGIRYDVFTGEHIEPATKHDGKLDEDMRASWAKYGKESIFIQAGLHDVFLNPKQALSLLAWLSQEKGKLEELAKEQS